MHQGEFAIIDWILMTLGPPLLGSGIGLHLGLVRGRPARAAIAGFVGGGVGAWIGVMLYCLAVLPSVSDPLIFTACVLSGFFLGAILPAIVAARPPNRGKAARFKPASAPLGAILGGLLGLLIGIAIAYLNVQPGSAAGVESFGYFMWPISGITIGATCGLIAVVALKKHK